MIWGRVQVQPVDGTFPGVDRILADATGVTREQVRHFEWGDDALTVLYRVSASDTESVRGPLEAAPRVDSFAHTEPATGTVDVLVHAQLPDGVRPLLSTVASAPIVVQRPMRCTDTGHDLSVMGTREGLTSAFEQVSSTLDVNIYQLGEYVPTGMGPLCSLTRRQQEALEAAHRLGFYDPARSVSYEDLGAALDCAPSSASDLLGRAERELVTAVLGPAE